MLDWCWYARWNSRWYFAFAITGSSGDCANVSIISYKKSARGGYVFVLLSLSSKSDRHNSLWAVGAGAEHCKTCNQVSLHLPHRGQVAYPIFHLLFTTIVLSCLCIIFVYMALLFGHFWSTRANAYVSICGIIVGRIPVRSAKYSSRIPLLSDSCRKSVMFVTAGFLL